MREINRKEMKGERRKQEPQLLTLIHPGTRLLGLMHHVSKSQTVGRQDSRVAVDEDCGHAQTTGYGASVLTSSTSKTGQ